MTVLLIKDRGWEIATSAWSVGSKGKDKVEICYVWNSSHGAGVSFTKLNLSINEFWRRIDGKTHVDLRKLEPE